VAHDSDHKLISDFWYGLGRPLALITEAARDLPFKARAYLYELAGVAPQDRKALDYEFSPPIPTVAFVIAGPEGGARMSLPAASISDDLACELESVEFETYREGGITYRAPVDLGYPTVELCWSKARFEALRDSCRAFVSVIRDVREIDPTDPRCLRAGVRP
jgi:hypothetical protein